MSANHNSNIFPVIQRARPQLHKIEKTHYKWPEPLETCGKVSASGCCKALSCGESVLQLSINIVPCWQLLHSGVCEKGLYAACSELWMQIEQLFFLILIYSFLPPLSYLTHQTWKRMRTQKHENNEYSGTGCNMAQRHHHWILHVIRKIFWLTYARCC